MSDKIDRLDELYSKLDLMNSRYNGKEITFRSIVEAVRLSLAIHEEEHNVRQQRDKK